MKIFGKLFSGTLLVVLAMMIIVSVVAYQANKIIGYMQVSKKTSEVVQRWDAVLLGSYDLLYSYQALDQLSGIWLSQIVGFEDALNALSKDERVPDLGPDAMEELKNTQNLWALTEESLKATLKALEDFQTNVVSEHPTLGRGGTGGMYSEYDRLSKSGELEPLALYYFIQLKNGLQKINSTNDSFKGVLRRMEVTIQDIVDETTSFTLLITSVLILASIAVAFIYAFVFARRIARRAVIIEKAMRKIADRDFTDPPALMGKDEIGMLAVHLREVTESLSGFFAMVKAAAKNVTDLKDSLSAGTTESAAAVNQISKNIESIKSQFSILDSSIAQSTKALADIGRYLNTFSQDSSGQAASMEQAGKELSETVEAVNSVSHHINDKVQSAEKLKSVVGEGEEQVQSTNEIIKSVSYDINGILEIIELIDQISEQTNILSMNAAIESAHAGAAGAGFAVVAEEIRKLAESTQDNAQRIGDALTSITDKITKVLEASDNSAQSLKDITGEVNSFASELIGISHIALNTSQKSIQVGEAIKESIEATRRFSQGTIDMNERHRAILDAMENIKAISDETMAGITEIDLGSKEILKSVLHVEEISMQSRERAAELESALENFSVIGDQNSPETNTQDNSDNDKTLARTAGSGIDMITEIESDNEHTPTDETKHSHATTDDFTEVSDEFVEDTVEERGVAVKKAPQPY